MDFQRVLHAVLGVFYKRIGSWYVFTFLGGDIGTFLRTLYIFIRGKTVCFRSKYGFFMEVSSYEHWMSGYLFLGETNPLETAFVRSCLRNGDTMIDVGAHNGWYSLVSSQCVGAGGCVLAFEPNPDCIRALKKNLHRNATHVIRVVDAALSDKTSHASFWMGDDMAGSLIKDQAEHVSGKKVHMKNVRTYRLDDYLKKLDVPPVRLIKIDVEGAELEVLKGATKTLTTYMPTLLIEVYCKDDAQVQKRNKVFTLLNQLGYVPYQLSQEGIVKTRFDRVSRDTINIVLQHKKLHLA